MNKKINKIAILTLSILALIPFTVSANNGNNGNTQGISIVEQKQANAFLKFSDEYNRLNNLLNKKIESSETLNYDLIDFALYDDIFELHRSILDYTNNVDMVNDEYYDKFQDLKTKIESLDWNYEDLIENIYRFNDGYDNEYNDEYDDEYDYEDGYGYQDEYEDEIPTFDIEDILSDEEIKEINITNLEKRLEELKLIDQLEILGRQLDDQQEWTLDEFGNKWESQQMLDLYKFNDRFKDIKYDFDDGINDADKELQKLVKDFNQYIYTVDMESDEMYDEFWELKAKIENLNK